MIHSVVGAGQFRSYSSQPCITLRPGQTAKPRDYYERTTRNVPDGKGYRENFTHFESVYTERQGKNVTPLHYRGRNTAVNLMLGYDYTHEPKLGELAQRRYASVNPRAEQSKTTGKSLYKSTAFWQSVYSQGFNPQAIQSAHRAEKPAWTQRRPAYICPRGNFGTEHEDMYGRFGDSPLKKHHPEIETLEQKLTEREMGTIKVTQHLPGYKGFIPSTDANRLAKSHSIGTGLRTTFLKNNIVENFLRKMPGYSGHLPVSAVNDHAEVKPTFMS